MSRPRWKKTVEKVAVNAVMAGAGPVHLVAVGRHIARTWSDLRSHGELPRFDLSWMGLALLLYLAGLCSFGLWFGQIMRASPTPVGRLSALRAYLISHLGKYVPGKALVVVMRVALVTPYGARPATAAFATLYETLVMMASGGLVAAIGFALAPSRRLTIALGPLGSLVVPLAWLALAPGLGLLLLTWPRVFPRLTRLMSLPFPGVGPDALPSVRHRLLAEGLLWSLVGWTLLGLSQVAVIRGLSPTGLPVSAWPLALASVALATVAGFVVALAPGGLGVREWVLWTSLGAVIDHDRAVISSLALRLIWVVGEGLAAGVLALVRPSLPLPDPRPESP